jgi:hypothetical protein
MSIRIADPSGFIVAIQGQYEKSMAIRPLRPGKDPCAVDVTANVPTTIAVTTARRLRRHGTSDSSCIAPPQD